MTLAPEFHKHVQMVEHSLTQRSTFNSESHVGFTSDRAKILQVNGQNVRSQEIRYLANRSRCSFAFKSR